MLFVTTRDKERIRNEYTAAPDDKSLVTSFTRMALVTGQPGQEAADRAAMESGEELETASEKADKACDLHASGNSW